MQKEKLTSPYDLVAKALECNKDTLNDDSAMVNHPKWDSLSHVTVIMALEKEYGIEISDEEVMKFDNMKAVVNLYQRLTAEQ
jgi:citrate synthase